ncbi:hypothetical protein BH10PAT1_BH10PAT1_5800 [soil metagenome]
MLPDFRAVCIDRRESMSQLEMDTQLIATKKLVDTLHNRLVENMSDRDGGTDWLEDQRRYDAFFEFSDSNLALEITSVGLPDQESNNGLFLYIYNVGEGYKQQIVGLQTCKVIEAVGESDATWLSRYSPEQLDIIREVVVNAKPISREDYQAL